MRSEDTESRDVQCLRKNEEETRTGPYCIIINVAIRNNIKPLRISLKKLLIKRYEYCSYFYVTFFISRYFL